MKVTSCKPATKKCFAGLMTCKKTAVEINRLQAGKKKVNLFLNPNPMISVK
jgi:hypothetical protein